MTALAILQFVIGLKVLRLTYWTVGKKRHGAKTGALESVPAFCVSGQMTHCCATLGCYAPPTVGLSQGELA